MSAMLLILVRHCGEVMRDTALPLVSLGSKSQLGCFLVVGFPASYSTSPSLSSCLCKIGEKDNTSLPSLWLVLFISIYKLLSPCLAYNKHYMHVSSNQSSFFLNSILSFVKRGFQRHQGVHCPGQHAGQQGSVGGGQGRA